MKSINAAKKTFTTGQVAKICDVAPRTVSQWFDSGQLPGYRIPGSDDRRIPRENLIQFLRSNGMPLWELGQEEWHKVLLLGTEQLTGDRLNDLLPEAEGFRFEATEDIFRAGRLVETFLPNAIVIDLSIGRSQSITIASGLRKDERYAHTSIIGLCGEDDAEHEHLKGQGFSDTFRKPFDVALLAERIRSDVAVKA